MANPLTETISDLHTDDYCLESFIHLLDSIRICAKLQ